jgi:hypothetical protein
MVKVEATGKATVLPIIAPEEREVLGSERPEKQKAPFVAINETATAEHSERPIETIPAERESERTADRSDKTTL